MTETNVETPNESVIETPPSTPDPVQQETPTLTGHQKFLEMLPEDLRSEPMFRNFDGDTEVDAIAKLAKSYANAQKLIGADPTSVLKIPSSEEDTAWNDVYTRLGRPEKPEDYNTEVLKDIQGIDEAKVKEITEVAHKNGVSSKALEAILSTYKDQMSGLSVQSEEQLNATYEEYDKQLKSYFGEAYDQRVGKIQSELKAKADPEFLSLAKDYPWVFDHPAVIKTFDAFIKASSESGSPKEGKTAGDYAMTPAEALAEINAMDGDKMTMTILTNPSDPRQKDLVAKRSKLFAMAYPNG